MNCSLLLAALLANAPAQPADPAAAGTAAPEADMAWAPEPSPPEEELPPGGGDDQRLWLDLKHATARGTLGIARIGQSAFRLKYGKYYEELDARVARGDAEAKRVVDALRAVARRAREALPENPRVFPCRHTLLDLQQRMGPDASPPLAKELVSVRAEARACVERIGTFLAAVTASAGELERELDRVDGYLKRARPAARAEKAPSASEARKALEAGAP